jgi:DNA-binding FadR family transcriptional regulator
MNNMNYLINSRSYTRRPQALELLQYLSERARDGSQDAQLPSLNDISQELGISVARLREQLEVAKVLGLVEIRPRTGMRRQPYSFSPAVWQSLAYSIEMDAANFNAFADLRNHVEAAYWEEAVQQLDTEDHAVLRNLIARAWEKLRGNPIHIPHAEHRQLHLCIFSKLQNPFVLGILEAYWEAYEEVGLNQYTDYDYLEQVWMYHERMVEAICSGDFKAGYQALIDHKDLLSYRPDRAVKAALESKKE